MVSREVYNEGPFSDCVTTQDSLLDLKIAVQQCIVYPVPVGNTGPYFLDLLPLSFIDCFFLES